MCIDQNYYNISLLFSYIFTAIFLLFFYVNKFE